MSLWPRPDDEIGKSRWGVRYSAFGQPSFCAVLEGSCRLTVDHRPLILEAGDFVFLPATPGSPCRASSLSVANSQFVLSAIAQKSSRGRNSGRGNGR